MIKQDPGASLPMDLGLLEGETPHFSSRQTKVRADTDALRRDLHHANRPTDTVHLLRATPTMAARTAQSKATVHRAENGLVIQISEQTKTKAEDGLAPRGPHSTSVVQANVHRFRRVSIYLRPQLQEVFDQPANRASM